MEVKAILEMIENASRRTLVQDIEEDSNFLGTQREDITNLWGLKPEVLLASFYETEKTKTVGKVGHSSAYYRPFK